MFNGCGPLEHSFSLCSWSKTSCLLLRLFVFKTITRRKNGTRKTLCVGWCLSLIKDRFPNSKVPWMCQSTKYAVFILWLATQVTTAFHRNPCSVGVLSLVESWHRSYVSNIGNPWTRTCWTSAIKIILQNYTQHNLFSNTLWQELNSPIPCTGHQCSVSWHTGTVVGGREADTLEQHHLDCSRLHHGCG